MSMCSLSRGDLQPMDKFVQHGRERGGRLQPRIEACWTSSAGLAAGREPFSWWVLWTTSRRSQEVEMLEPHALHCYWFVL